MSYYTDKNSLAEKWNRDDARIELAKWAYYHPEDFRDLLELVLEKLNNDPSLMEPMSNEDIDKITGVSLNG